MRVGWMKMSFKCRPVYIVLGRGIALTLKVWIMYEYSKYDFFTNRSKTIVILIMILYV